MLNKILNSIVEACVEGFQWGFNLGRYGNSKGKPEIDINQSHKSLAESIFNSSCITLNEIGTIYPTFFIVKEDQFMPIMLDPKSLKEINLAGYASMVTNIADDQDAEALVFISEQWQITRKLSDTESKEFEEGKKIPSLDPDRQEVLCLIYLTSKGKIKALMGNIQRGPDNTPFVRDSKWSDKTDTTFFQPWR